MGGCRCSYRNCANTTKTRENLHFFHYPVKNKDRCRQWIVNAEKQHFYNLDEDQLRNKVVCETHFELSNFTNSEKKRLLHAAIPTLLGDCEPPAHARPMKAQDVNILPTNAEGTIFVLETHVEEDYRSEKVETYIYTHNGLVLPMAKAKEERPEPLFEPPPPEPHPVLLVQSEPPARPEPKRRLSERSAPGKRAKLAHLDPLRESPTPTITGNLKPDDKFLRKIKEHSKDIAILKRMLKRKNSGKSKPSLGFILSHLKRHLPASMFRLVSFQLRQNATINEEDFELFSEIYSKSPDLYGALCDKFQWKLPDPETLIEIDNENGHS